PRDLDGRLLLDRLTHAQADPTEEREGAEAGQELAVPETGRARRNGALPAAGGGGLGRTGKALGAGRRAGECRTFCLFHRGLRACGREELRALGESWGAVEERPPARTESVVVERAGGSEGSPEDCVGLRELAKVSETVGLASPNRITCCTCSSAGRK